jgi:hypothetical protein
VVQQLQQLQFIVTIRRSAVVGKNRFRNTFWNKRTMAPIWHATISLATLSDTWMMQLPFQIFGSTTLDTSTGWLSTVARAWTPANSDTETDNETAFARCNNLGKHPRWLAYQSMVAPGTLEGIVGAPTGSGVQIACNHKIRGCYNSADMGDGCEKSPLEGCATLQRLLLEVGGDGGELHRCLGSMTSER